MEVMESSPVVSTAQAVGKTGIPDLEKVVRAETLEGLTKAGIIREEETAGFKKYLESNEIGVGDILPVMAELRGIEEGEQTFSVEGWARALAPIVKKRHSLVPFAGKLLGSASLFEKYPTVKEAAAAVKCPLIFSEDADVLGFGTINPVASLHLSSFVAEYFKEESGMTPYLSIFLIDLPTWQTICRRQFK